MSELVKFLAPRVASEVMAQTKQADVAAQNDVSEPDDEQLEREGVRTKVLVSKCGRSRGGGQFGRGSLFHLLRNRIYLGEIVHKDTTHPGLHPAILDRDLFEQVQRLLDSHRGQRRERQASNAPLAGVLFDALGNRMAASHSRGRGSKRYLYYISPVPASHQETARLLRRVPASNLEELLIERLRCWAGRPAGGWSDLLPFVRRVELYRSAVVVEVEPPSHEAWRVTETETSTLLGNGFLRITSPMKVRTRGGRTERIDASARPARYSPDRALIAGLRRAHIELKAAGIDITDPRSPIESARGIDDPYLRKLTRIAFLAPDIQRIILEGRQPPGLKLADLLAHELPFDWDEQRRLFDIV